MHHLIVSSSFIVLSSSSSQHHYLVPQALRPPGASHSRISFPFQHSRPLQHSALFQHHVYQHIGHHLVRFFFWFFLGVVLMSGGHFHLILLARADFITLFFTEIVQSFLDQIIFSTTTQEKAGNYTSGFDFIYANPLSLSLDWIHFMNK